MISDLLYNNILDKDGGPIFEIKHRHVVYFEPGYEGYAYLNSALIPPFKYNGKIYGKADGTGYSKDHKIALHKAISEALERWAFYATVETGLWGFDHEPTTTGMAAYPSFFHAKAKKMAILEAFERWCVMEWWNGCLDGQHIKNIEAGLNAIIFNYKKYCTVILYKNFEVQRMYGFGSGADLSVALYKAKIELYRNYDMVSVFDIMCESESIIDKRLLYFASKEGQLAFDQRVADNKNRALEPRLDISCEIKGPWSKYAVVWRSLFYISQNKFSNQDQTYFCF